MTAIISIDNLNVSVFAGYRDMLKRLVQNMLQITKWNCEGIAIKKENPATSEELFT